MVRLATAVVIPQWLTVSAGIGQSDILKLKAAGMHTVAVSTICFLMKCVGRS